MLRLSVNREIGSSKRRSSVLLEEVCSNLSIVQRLRLEQTFPYHDGCVNTVSWNENGTRLLSGGDDLTLLICDPFSGQQLHRFKPGHRTNIYSAKFMPQSNDSKTVSCCSSGIVCFTDVHRPSSYGEHKFSCHNPGLTYDVVTIPRDAACFLSCGDDGTVRFFDVRQRDSCQARQCDLHTIVKCRKSVTAIAVNHISTNVLATACSDGSVRLYDRRFLSSEDATDPDACSTAIISRMAPISGRFSVTSVKFSPDCKQLLVSYSSDKLMLYDLQNLVSFEELSPEQKHEITGASGTSNSVEGPDHPRNQAPPQKRLRIRGDWSDTGPNAQPTEESGETPTASPFRPATRLGEWLQNTVSAQLGPASQPPSNAREPSQGSSEPSVVEGSGIRVISSSAAANDPPPTRTSGQVSGLQLLMNHLHNSTFGGDSQSSSPPVQSPPPPCDSASEAAKRLQRFYRQACKSKKLIQHEVETIKYAKPCQVFTGHRNVRTVIKEATFWGSNFIMSGSDCGHIFVWSSETGELVNLLEADTRVVNCIQPHPNLPVLVSSGIDHDFKLWTPSGLEPTFGASFGAEVMARNKVLLEQTRDTITVPANFVLRMLASLNHSVRQRDTSQNNDDDDATLSD